MKTYKRRFAKNALKAIADSRTETRDGVLWAYDTDSTCLIKIQGSNELITAHYPRNLVAKPDWLRIGNSLRVVHRRGVHGFIEVVGPGRSIPAPTIGNSLPPTGVSGDGIIYGLVVTATSPNSEGVVISNGSYRINGNIYYYTGEVAGQILMQDPPVMVMGATPHAILGSSSFVVDMDGAEAPPEGQQRFDLIVIGADGVTDYIIGTATTGTPIYPVIPPDHILVAPILRISGDTSIPQTRIYVPWTTPVPSSAIAEYITEVPWATQQFTITVRVLDQYGRTIASGWTGEGYTYEMMQTYGTGQINTSSGSTGWVDEFTAITRTIYGYSSCNFYYRRYDESGGAEANPMFLITVSTPNQLIVTIHDIQMYDINGFPV